VRYTIFSILAFIFLTGFTVKKDGFGREVRYDTSSFIGVCVVGDYPLDPNDVEAAIQVWMSSMSSLEMMIVPTGPDCQIEVEFDSAWTDKDGIELANTGSKVSEQTGFLTRSYIRINGTMPWAMNGRNACSGEFDLVTVLAHELGHALGFDDLPDEMFPDELMKEHRLAGDLHRYLGLSDRAGLEYLYPIVDETMDEVGVCTCLVVPNKQVQPVTIAILLMIVSWFYQRRPIKIRVT
jgi:hypothetical protein